MKKLLIQTSLLSTVCLMVIGLSSCSSAPSNVEVLRVYNWEDYIYVNDPDNGYDNPNMTTQFETFMLDTYGRNVSVVYDTFDTNETMLNSLKTGKSSYDLVCPSDYMIQKMLANDMLEPFEDEKIANYVDYASPYLQNIFDNITATSISSGDEYVVGDYAAGYMWGTLGLIFNPSFGAYSSFKDDTFSDFQLVDALWDQKYKATFSIKDSVRDTYAFGLLKTYEENELKPLYDSYQNDEIAASEYNSRLTEIFNRCSDENINEIKPNLFSLKDNSFGFEVDSGKEDIKTNKIGANIAWSGDAVYSMDDAEEQSGLELYYSVPQYGSNIWFDGWVMPKGANTELAQLFVNFLSDPVNASQNMNSIGYTTFICGDDVRDLVRSWYDVRGDYGFFNLVVDEDDNVTSSTYVGNTYNDYINLSSSGNSFFVYIGEDEIEDIDFPPLVLDDYEEVDVASISEVDLSYLFNNTLDTYDSEYKASTFLTYEYLSFEDEGNVAVGRQFFCQYPDEETATRCAIMKDFGSQNDAILKMWQDVKSNSLPIWAIILLILEVLLALSVILFFVIKKYSKKKRREMRKHSQ